MPQSPPTKLLVTADDYALTVGTSRAVLRAHESGVVSATSVLAVGQAFEVTAPWLVGHPTLAVGAHLALAGEDRPLLAGTEIPSLVDSEGRLAPSWQVFVRRLLTGRIDPDDITREWSAQWERLQGAGLEISHLNAHQHLQLWPSVGTVLAELARSWGVPVVRAPTAEGLRVRSVAIRRLAWHLRTRLAAATLVYPVAFAGLVDAGRMDGPRLRATLARLARDGPASAEIVVHVGEDDDPQRRSSEEMMAWSQDLDAVVDPATSEAIRRHGFRLSHPRELGTPSWASG